MFKKRPKQLNLSSVDGFPLLQAEPWYKDKLGIIQSYLKAYHSRFDLRNKTKLLLYIGAGPGIVSFGEDENIEQAGTPLELISDSNEFQRYIFCEKNPEYAQALKVRLGKIQAKRHSMVIEGDINRTIEKLGPYLPEKIGKSPTSILCIIDLQSFDLDSETLEVLAEMDADLILVNSFVHTPYYSYKFYLDEEREQMNAYFGSAWARFAEDSTLQSDTSFFMLVVKAYGEKLKQLGYNVSGTLHKYNLEDALVPYYQIAYCTKAKSLKKVKTQMVQEAVKQTNLFES